MVIIRLDTGEIARCEARVWTCNTPGLEILLRGTLPPASGGDPDLALSAPRAAVRQFGGRIVRFHFSIDLTEDLGPA